MAKKGEMLKIDFSDVDERVDIPEGTYRVRVKNVEKRVSEKSDKPYLNWELQIVDGDAKGGTLYHTTSLQPQALFNLRDTLTALGFKVPKSAINLDLSKVIKREMAVKVTMEEYQGKDRPRISNVFSVTKLDEEPEEEDVEDEEEEEEDVEDLDLDEL